MRLNEHNFARIANARKSLFQDMTDGEIAQLGFEAQAVNDHDKAIVCNAELDLRKLHRDYEFDIRNWTDEQLCYAILLAYHRSDLERVRELDTELQRRKA